MTIALFESLMFGLGRLRHAASQAGHRLCLLTRDRTLYGYELSRPEADQLDVVDVDTTDIAACETVLRKIPDLAGLISPTDGSALVGAELVHRLGLPGLARETVRTLRDKGQVRELLHREGLSPSASVPVEPSADHISRAADAVGFPLVLKDSAGTASRSVWVIRDEQEVHWAAREALSAPLRGHLIAERYFTGPLYSAETLTWDGHTRLLGITGRILSPEPLRRENAAAFPVAFPADDHAGLEKWTSRVLAAVGYQQGFAHVELALASEGPQLVEINGRIAGAVIGEAMCRSLDTNVYAAMVSMALGERPALLDSELTLGRGQGMIYLHPSRPGTLTGWSGLERLPAFPGHPEWLPAASPGDRIEHLADQRGCTGFVIADGPTAELALYNALTAADTITHHMDPLA